MCHVRGTQKLQIFTQCEEEKLDVVWSVRDCKKDTCKDIAIKGKLKKLGQSSEGWRMQ